MDVMTLCLFFLQNLANILCQQLNIRHDYCFIAISELQNTALDNLRSIAEFNETGKWKFISQLGEILNENFLPTGIATLKVRVPCKSNGTKLLSFKIKLTEDAKNLQELIAAKLEIAPENIKVIANGKVLDLCKPLDVQGVKNNKQIMALVTENDAETVEDPYARIKKIRKEADLLLQNKDSNFLSVSFINKSTKKLFLQTSRFHQQIEDQSGKAIHLPEEERRSIIMALLLYEKGRVQLKEEKFSDALIMFLEADEELKYCQSNLVQSVDNVALLNLDIVWCYLNLKSITQLPDAEARLKVCEENFKRSYGENFSRVKSLKGSSENERSLIARLHLMKGILCFHQNRRDEAKYLMDMAEKEINELKIDDQSVNLLIEMGYTKSEAVTGLRSSFNSLDGAVSFILDRRQKLSASRVEGANERKIQTVLNMLGITNANPRSVVSLSAMGYPQELCALALQKCENDIEIALNLLQLNQEGLKAELIDIIKPDEKLIDELVSLGYDENLAVHFLKNNINDFQKTLDALLEMQNNNTLPPELMDIINNASDSYDEPSTSSSSPAGGSRMGKDGRRADARKRRHEKAELEALDGLRNDLSHLDDADEYLTFTLEKEQAFLIQYRNALKQ